MKISIFGTGYVGLVTGACLADYGNEIICVDIDSKKIDLINSGVSPIYEPELDKLLKKNKKSLKATTDHEFAIKNSEITFICVGTPPKEDGSIDLSYIKKVSENIGNCLKQKDWHVIVV